MPSALTYPGVYLEEVPSGIHTITGVATSVTAFIGAATTGPVETALTINSFADFERLFGGLWQKSYLGFAIRDFFLNGGAQAIVIRLFHSEDDPTATQKLTAGALKFIAASPGKWGAGLRVSVDVPAAVDPVADDIAASLGVTKADLFSLTVRNSSPGGASERFANLTVKNSARRVDNVLLAGSALLRYDGVPDPAAALAAALDALGVLDKGLADAQKTLSDKLNADPAAVVTVEKAARDKAKKDLDDAVLAASTALLPGVPLASADFLPVNGMLNKKGLFALEQTDLFNLLCIPPYRASTDTLDVDVNLVSTAAAYCETRRAMLIVDAPKNWITKDDAKTKFLDTTQDNVGTKSRNAALFFPRLMQPNPLHDDQMEAFAACGTVAGIFARTDTQRGVWKAPAGLDATLVGTPALATLLTDAENGELNPLGINCLRSFPSSGRVVWGARTLRGNDQLADEYKYIPVRRTALFIEESLYRGLKWAVFEPNDSPLWAQIRLNAGAFMQNLFRQGAFEGSSAKDAYFVKCDKDTTTQNDIDLGIVNVVVGFAPLKPAEFVVIKVQQMAGQLAV
jgi:uncharacterized protein